MPGRDVSLRTPAGPPVPGVSTRAIVIPAAAHPDQDNSTVQDSSSVQTGIQARLYTPDGLAAGSPMLVFLHGGGWVTGSLSSHDAVCRYLALHAGVRQR